VVTFGIQWQTAPEAKPKEVDVSDSGFHQLRRVIVIDGVRMVVLAEMMVCVVTTDMTVGERRHPAPACQKESRQKQTHQYT